MTQPITRPHRVLACAVVLLVSTAPVGSAQNVESSQDRSARLAVREAHEALIAAYASVDIDALAGLMDPSDDLLIFHPRGNLRFSTLPSVRRGLERMLEYVGPSTWSDERESRVIVEGDVAWHTYVLRMEWSGEVEPADVRGTEIWVKRAGGWRLVHAHWSANETMGHAGRESHGG